MKVYATDLDAVLKLRKEEAALKARIENGEDLKKELEDLQEEIESYAAEEEEDDGMDRDF
jgi:hypothetical protein